MNLKKDNINYSNISNLCKFILWKVHKLRTFLGVGEVQKIFGNPRQTKGGEGSNLIYGFFL